MYRRFNGLVEPLAAKPWTFSNNGLSECALELLHRHSTLFGFMTTAVLVVSLGPVFHWSPVSFAVMIPVGFVGALFLSRVFYGWSAARALDKEPASNPAKFGRDHDTGSPTPTEDERLENAIQASEGFGLGAIGPDPGALARLAEEEAQNKE